VLAALLLGAVAACPAQPPIERALADAARPGEAQWLAVGARRFLALYRIQDAPRPKGGIILLHDVGEHADWPAVLGPLRKGLALRGWQTLSVQLAAPQDAAEPQSALPADAVARLGAAVTFLVAKKVNPLVIIGHGFGAAVATAYLAAAPSPAVAGAVLISPAHATRRFAKVRVPVLDIYGELERNAVVDAVRTHKRVRRAAPLGAYRAVTLPGVGHDLGGVEGAVVLRRVRGWIRHLSATAGP